jgi:hypothetical protein
MPFRLRSLALALAAAACLAPALAAGVPPVAVQERVLKLPELPVGTDASTTMPEDGAIKMPFVTGGVPGVARRINEAVWHEMLMDVPVPVAAGKTFTLPLDKLVQSTTSLEYKAQWIPAASPRVLSLAFSGEGCGAYCEGFTITRLFDLRDGHALALGELVTVEGFDAIGRRIDTERRRAYQKQVRELRAALKSAPRGKKEDDDDTAERLAFNEDCLKQVDTAPTTPQRLLDDVFSLDGRGALELTIGRCSNHAMRALDDVDQLTVTFPAPEMKPLLTPYGLAVVRQEGDAPPPPASFDTRELHGRLGGLAVTMKLEPLHEGVETRGWYAYDKYRTPIALVVRREGRSVHAVEQTEARGRFELTPAGGTLTGTWSDKDDRKQLPVILQ